jgi:two-component system chemotaxis response regulator CheB
MTMTPFESGIPGSGLADAPRDEAGIPSRITTVVIGASAGGVEALGLLLPALPADFAPAVIVVLHIVADRESLLTQIFSERCALPVSEAIDKEPVRSGHIYFAPPDYHLQVETDGAFSLSMDDPVNYSRPSIDVLFESVAWSVGDRALGLLLTGANADGAAGLAAIRAAGGSTWVQDPATAFAEAMPRSAIERNAADEILTLPAMARRLGSWRSTNPVGRQTAS